MHLKSLVLNLKQEVCPQTYNNSHVSIKLFILRLLDFL